MRDASSLLQYAGQVPTPQAVYRPANVFGALGVETFIQALGLAFYSPLATLEQERDALAGEERAILKAIEAAGGKRTDDQTTRLMAIDERFEGGDGKPGLTAEIAAEKRRRERERNEESLAGPAEMTGDAKPAEDKAPAPFGSLGEQLQAVARTALQPHAGVHPGLKAINEHANKVQAATGASEIVGADGGFLVQQDLQNGLLNAIFSRAVLAPLAQTREVGRGFNGIKFNVIDETSRATGSRYGGVRVYWVAEGGQKTASRPKLRQIDLTLQKLAGLYVATDELLQDTVALDSVVRPAFEAEMAFAVDDAMIRGTGAGMPLGILNSPALVSVAKEGGQAADTFLYENAVAMFGRFAPGSIRTARWFMNQAVWAGLPLMTLTLGTGGVPVFLPPGGVSDAPFGTLLGRPIEVIEQASAIGDVGDVILADWSAYLLLRKGGIQQDTSIHVYFDTDETAFRWVLRINGRPLQDAPVTPYKGSATTSPFVTLAAR